MNAAFCLIAIAALGVDVGWQPLEEGGVEYIIQIAPAQVDRMVKLDDLVSEVPKGLDVRRYRITIGTEKLPRNSGKIMVAKPGSDKPSLLDSASPKREVIAEGAIRTGARAPLKVEVSTDSPTATPEATEAAPAEATESSETEGPVLPPAETTTQKPVAGTFADPEPQDEEGGESNASRYNDRSAVSTGGDAPFKSPALRPSQSRYADEPAEERSARTPAKKTRFAADETDENYEAQKPPALSTAMRTAQADTRSGSGFDRDSGPTETSWMVAIFFVLLLSAGLNMYLFWIAHEARVRYQALLEKYRAGGGKMAVEVV